MDTFFLEAIVAELRERIPAGARIDKIHQPAAETLILRLWSGRDDLRLLLSAEPGRSRLHLTTASPPNPGVPPRFCQLLRARLARIEDVQGTMGERIVRFACRGRGGEKYALVAELFGTTPNLLLLDAEERIVDALHRSGGGREIEPRSAYAPPAPLRRLSMAERVPELPPEASDPARVERWLLDHLTPMTPLAARDLAAAVAAGISPDDALGRFRLRWLAREYRPFVGRLSGKEILSPFPLPHLPVGEIREFSSPSAAADAFYGTDSGSGLKSELEEGIRRALQRLRSRQSKIASDRQRLPEKMDSRRYGELILANLHRVRPGMREVTVEDWYADPPVPLSIPLDPLLSPQENAERYFRTYKKGKRGEEHIARRLRETEDEIAWMEEAQEALAEAETAEDFEALRRELEDGGVKLTAALPSPRRRGPDIRELLRRGRTPGGFEIVWGKNSRTNDFVSRELAAPDDLWFHAHRLPGCHLVLRRGGKAVPEEDVLFAAAVAAGYSRSRNEGKVEVMVSEGRWVRKPKGARPGLVTVEKYRTVVVRPVRFG